MWNGHQRAARKHTRGSQRTKRNIPVCDKEGLEGFQYPFLHLFDTYQIVTWFSQNLQTLSSYIFLNHTIHSMTMYNL